jgi:uncharacterized protein (TIGR02679 family)
MAEQSVVKPSAQVKGSMPARGPGQAGATGGNGANGSPGGGGADADGGPEGAATGPDRLRQVLGADELRWLVERARARLERRRDGGVVTLKSPTEAQRLALAKLLGRPVGRGTSLTVALATVERALVRRGIAVDLRTAVEALTGPIRDLKAERYRWAVAWARAVEPAWDLWDRRPELHAWGDWLRAAGILRRLTGDDPKAARRLMQQAVAVLDRLPADGVGLNELSAATTGDPNSLDPGQPLATLVLRAAADLGGLGNGSGGDWRGSVWASVGVLTGELANPVLTLNLPGAPTTTTGSALALLAESGQPAYVTARQLLRDRPDFLFPRGSEVFVCEHPGVVAAAAQQIGAGGSPLVCTGGRPGAAATALLQVLIAHGARLRYHGDFDWHGITTANGVIARFGAAPWRMDADAYRGAVKAVDAGRGGASVGAGQRRTLLRGSPVEAIWDAELTAAMCQLRRRVEEDQVIDSLLADLAR